MEPTRADHLAWCKQRALAYVDRGNASEAISSMISDLSKHPATAGHPGAELGLLQAMCGLMETPAQVRSWIEGFN